MLTATAVFSLPAVLCVVIVGVVRDRVGGDVGVRRRGSRGARSRLERRCRRVQAAEIDIAVMGRREGESRAQVRARGQRDRPGADMRGAVHSISADRGRERAGQRVDAGDRHRPAPRSGNRENRGWRDRNDNAAVFLDDGVMHAAIDTDRRRENDRLPGRAESRAVVVGVVAVIGFLAAQVGFGVVDGRIQVDGAG